MTPEFIQKRIDGKKKEIAKLTAKLERIKKAEATGWKVNPYYYDERDKRRTEKEIEEAARALADYEGKLKEEQEKAASRNVPAILEFLENWKKRVFAFYEEDIIEYFKAKEICKELYNEYAKAAYGTPEAAAAKAAYETKRQEIFNKTRGYFRKLTDEEKKQPKFRYTHEIKIEDGEWEHIMPYIAGANNGHEACAKLTKELETEANRKYDFIIERTVAITGTITDASGLRVGEKADLNGYIHGEKGTAKVQTIGAGGHNIQCFHFRTLINRA